MKDYLAIQHMLSDSSSMFFFALGSNGDWLSELHPSKMTCRAIERLPEFFDESIFDAMICFSNHDYISLFKDKTSGVYLGLIIQENSMDEELNGCQTMIGYVQLMYVLINEAKLDLSRIQFLERDMIRNMSLSQQNLEFFFRKRIENHEQSFVIETLLIDNIRKGKIANIKSLFMEFKQRNSEMIFADKTVDVTIKSICLIAILTRVAIDEGVLPAKSFLLSDSLIRLAMQQHTAVDAMVFVESIILRFTELIHKNHLETMPMSINQIKQYIDSHLYEPVSLTDIAKFMNYSTSYVSRLFKKHMQITVGEYIIHAKINEAKLLLAYTHKTSLEISSLLAFTHQSHFIQRFKELVKQTPHQYRCAYQTNDDIDLSELILRL